MKTSVVAEGSVGRLGAAGDAVDYHVDTLAAVEVDNYCLRPISGGIGNDSDGSNAAVGVAWNELDTPAPATVGEAAGGVVSVVGGEDDEGIGCGELVMY